MGELLLLIDTAGADGSLALASMGDEPRVLRAAVLPGRSASERLFPALREMLAQEGGAAAGLRAVSVVVGPGSFTGVRVGLAAAKGLAEALTIPVVGLSRLAVLAEAARDSLADGREQRLLALLDAGRQEVFAGKFREGARAAEWEGVLTGPEVARLGTEWTPVVEETGVGEMVRNVMRETSREAQAKATASEMAGVIQLEPLSAASGLRLAMARVRAGKFDDVGGLDARYLRRTPAEMAREKGDMSAAGSQPG